MIVYGTSRGTTTTIAEAIAEGMKAAGGSATAIRLDYLRLMPDRIRTAEVLGIGSPVYFLRETGYMTEFISGLPSLEGKKAFVFCTTGMDRVGETLLRMHTLLSERGAVVVGAESFRSAMSYYPHRKRGLGNPEHMPDENECAAARRFGERMALAPMLDPITAEPVSLATRLKARLLADTRLRQTFFPKVRLVLPACTGYGSCLSRCLFSGLDRKNGEEIPFYTESCVQCLECLAWCPREGIVIDSPMKEWLSTLSYRLGIH